MTDAYIFNGRTNQNNQTDKICNNEKCVSQNTNSLDNRNKSEENISTKDKEGDLCLHAESCTKGTSNQNEGLVNLLKENTMSKYVNKKGDDIKISEKLKGHFKNSLKRKKRSFYRNIEDNGNTNVPGIYDVIKAQNIERGELNLPKLDASEIIKASDIADFNIETLHKSDKPDHNKLQREDQRIFSHVNNNQYLPNSKKEEDSNNGNLSYQDDEYGTLIKDENSFGNQRGPNPHAQKHTYQGNFERKNYSPKSGDSQEKRTSQESEENNTRKDKNQENQENSSNEDENDENSNENYQRGEKINQNIKTPNNVLAKGNIRYYRDRKNKYHISQPKKLNDESSEDVSRENINENSSSFEEDDSNPDEKFKELKVLDVNRKQPKTLLHSQKQKYLGDNTKQIDKDNFSYQEDENDEEPDENLHGYEKLPENNVHRQNERYYNNNQSHIPTSKKSDDYSDETSKREDTEYEDDEDGEKSHENFKKDRQSTDDVLEQHNQKFHGKRNKYFLSGLRDLDENEEKNYENEDADDYSPDTNLNNNRDTHEKIHAPNNILQKPNQLYFNNKNNKYQQPELKKHDKDNNERQDTYKENQDNEDVNERRENLNSDRLVHENKQHNNLLQTQNPKYYSKNNKYYFLPKNPKEESSENYEGEGKNKENKYDEDTKGGKNYNTNDGLLTTTEETLSQSYKFIDSERENSAENNSGLKYANQPKYSYSGNAGRPEQLSTNVRSIPVITNFNGNSKENFSDKRQKEIEILNNNNENSPNIQKTLAKPKAIQEVDFSNFSYDKFRGLNDIEKLKSGKDSHENYESDSLVTTTSTSKPKIKKKSKTAKIKKPNKLIKQGHINKGKAKPVIELINENSSEEIQKDLNEKSSHFGTVLPNKKAVKQQFERIPLNYNHATKNNPTKNIESEGTLDTLSPVNNQYDQHLNSKFGDIAIKLPEIRLPEDILTYAQETKGNSKDKQKINYFNYHNDDDAQYSKKTQPQGNPESYHDYVPTDIAQYSEQPKPKGDKPAEEYDFFASYIKKPREENNADDTSSNSDIEDGEDLYERFVRERFGRKDSFKERSEKVQQKKSQENRPTTKNKELFENIQKAIKKAEQVQKEAEKSKDPNASYLWTLEYGEKL